MVIWSKTRKLGLYGVLISSCYLPVFGQVAPPVPRAIAPKPMIPKTPVPNAPAARPAVPANRATTPATTNSNSAGTRANTTQLSGGAARSLPAVPNSAGAAGTATANIPANIQQQLNLSRSQISQIGNFQNNFNQQMNELSNRFQSDPQGTTSLATNAQQQLQQQINSVMTPAQRQTLSQITGTADPFSGDSPLQNGASTTTALNQAAVAGGQNIPASTGTALQGNSTQSGTNANPLAGTLGNSGQYLVANSLLNPNLAQSLNLTPAQQSQLANFQGTYNQQISELGNRVQSDPQGTKTLATSAQQQLQQNVNSILTPNQQQLLTQSAANPAQAGVGSSLPGSIGTLPSTNEGAYPLPVSGNNDGGAQAQPTESPNPVSPTPASSTPAAPKPALTQNLQNNLGQTKDQAAKTSNPANNSNLQQSAGFTELSDPKNQRLLQLSESQQSQLQQYRLDYVQQLGNLSTRFRTDPQGALSEYNDGLRDIQRKINSVLSPQQQRVLKILVTPK